MKKIILVSVLMLAVLVPLKNVRANTTTMYVEPQITTVEIFKPFPINISVSQVVDLAAWEFKLYYINEYLNATQIQEGPFLKTAGQTSFFIKEFTDNYNTTHGRIWAFCTLIGQGPGATGNGTVATITFKAKLAGTTTLKLAETEMLDSKMPPNHIIHTTIDGIVEILGPDIDVAVIEITVYPTKIPKGNPVYINVTVKNQGNSPESFTVYVFADGLHPPFGDEYVLPPQTVSNLSPGESTKLEFIWDTTSVTPGSYTISAKIPPISGETNTDNNFLKGPIVGGIFEPTKNLPPNNTINLSWLLIILNLIMVGIAAIRFLKKLGSEKTLIY